MKIQADKSWYEAMALNEGQAEVGVGAGPIDSDEMFRPLIDRIADGWGKWVEVDAGWKDLLLVLDRRLAEIDPNYVIQYVKEKFGGLRFCTPIVTYSAEALILVRIAEVEASVTCETCGKPGETRSHLGWLKTLCTPCSAAWVQARVERRARDCP